MRSASVGLLVALIFLDGQGALAAPAPSPSLDSLLVPPPSSGYVRDSTIFTPIQGNFDAVDYLGVITPRKPSETLATLREDGFVQGFGRAWLDRTANRFLVELVVAFGGGAGAGRWLPEARSLSQDNPSFKNDLPVTGIDTAFGAHFEEPATPAYADAIGFVKGNDFFFLSLFSTKNDLADTATKQARQQFDSAPAQTIPPTKWPENASSNISSTSLSFQPVAGIAIIAIAGAVVLFAAVLLAVLLISRRRRGGAAAAQGSLQMSADGNYWWDGQAWRNASEVAPLTAERSHDGHYWWDGARWRQMPAEPGPAIPQPAKPEPATQEPGGSEG
jgi:hypothetical protein